MQGAGQHVEVPEPGHRGRGQCRRLRPAVPCPQHRAQGGPADPRATAVVAEPGAPAVDLGPRAVAGDAEGDRPGADREHGPGGSPEGAGVRGDGVGGDADHGTGPEVGEPLSEDGGLVRCGLRPGGADDHRRGPPAGRRELHDGAHRRERLRRLRPGRPARRCPAPRPRVRRRRRRPPARGSRSCPGPRRRRSSGLPQQQVEGGCRGRGSGAVGVHGASSCVVGRGQAAVHDDGLGVGLQHGRDDGGVRRVGAALDDEQDLAPGIERRAARASSGSRTSCTGQPGRADRSRFTSAEPARPAA